MSIRSYQRNVDRKVTGPQLPVCFPAAIEQVSPRNSYRPNVYRNYREFVNYLDSLTLEELKKKEVLEEYETVIEDLVRPLGGLALEDLVMKRITTPLGLFRAFNSLVADDYRIIIDIKYGNASQARSVHSVGIIPVQDDLVTLVSTHVPKQLQGIIPLSKVAKHLAISTESPTKGHPLGTANLIAIPN